MNKEEKVYVLETVEREGFDYAFTEYSDFNEVKDEEFHRLRVMYKRASQALAEYIGYPEDVEILEKETQM